MWSTGTSREYGFTLLELLVVIALIGLLASVGAQTVLHSGAHLDQQADRVEQSLHRANIQARKSGLPVYIACAQLAKDSTELPEDDTSGTSCRSGHNPKDSLTFYPDGSSSGETIEIQVGDDQVRLLVDWLSGEIARD